MQQYVKSWINVFRPVVRKDGGITLFYFEPGECPEDKEGYIDTSKMEDVSSIIEGRKPCSICGVWLPASEFEAAIKECAFTLCPECHKKRMAEQAAAAIRDAGWEYPAFASAD